MNKTNPQQLTIIQENRALMKHLGKYYASAMKSIKRHQASNIRSSRLAQSNAYINMIDASLAPLSKETRAIATNELLHQGRPEMCDLAISPSTYYRKRDNAIQEFLDCLRQ